MVNWEKYKELQQETTQLKADGLLDAAAFETMLTRAINEANAGRFVEGFIKFAPPEWIAQNVRLLLES